MKQVEIGGQNYQINKLDPMKQLFIAKRIAPLIAALASRRLDNEFDATAGGTDKKTQVQFVVDITEAIGKLSDDDTEFVVNLCLGACKRQSAGNTWAPVKPPGAARSMFNDIELPQMLSLTFEVIMENLGGFLGGSGLPSIPTTATPA